MQPRWGPWGWGRKEGTRKTSLPHKPLKKRGVIDELGMEERWNQWGGREEEKKGVIDAFRCASFFLINP